MITLAQISKTYQRGSTAISALNNINLTIQPGEFVAIMGPSGSGKSSLLNILGALDQPSEGKYLLDGDEVSMMNDDQASSIRNQKIGFVFQSFHLLPRLSVLENVLLPQRYSKHLDTQAQQRAVALLERIGLGQRLHHLPGELSGGQLQRAAVARALLHQPALLLADEPTGNLDSRSAAEVLQLFKELNANGQTLVLVTHDPGIASHASRTLHLADGKIQASNP